MTTCPAPTCKASLEDPKSSGGLRLVRQELFCRSLIASLLCVFLLERFAGIEPDPGTCCRRKCAYHEEGCEWIESMKGRSQHHK